MVTPWSVLNIDEWWRWVAEHASQLEMAVPEDVAYELISQALEGRNSAFTVTVRDAATSRHFTFSANGDGERFAELDQLVAGAPTIAGLVFEAFEPAQGFV